MTTEGVDSVRGEWTASSGHLVRWRVLADVLVWCGVRSCRGDAEEDAAM